MNLTAIRNPIKTRLSDTNDSDNSSNENQYNAKISDKVQKPIKIIVAKIKVTIYRVLNILSIDLF